MAKYVVRYGIMRHLGIFVAKGTLRRGTRVIARTERGLESGEVLTEATEQAIAQAEGSPQRGTILREQAEDDRRELLRLPLPTTGGV